MYPRCYHGRQLCLLVETSSGYRHCMILGIYTGVCDGVVPIENRSRRFPLFPNQAKFGDVQKWKIHWLGTIQFSCLVGSSVRTWKKKCQFEDSRRTWPQFGFNTEFGKRWFQRQRLNALLSYVSKSDLASFPQQTRYLILKYWTSGF